MKKIVGDILKNRNIDDGLKVYYKEYMSINNKYSLIRLAMNYYMYYTIVRDNGGQLFSENMSALTKINLIVEKVLEGNCSGTEDIEQVLKLRQDIIEKVKDATEYVDSLRIFEHAINRVEYRFKEEDYPDGYSDEKITRSLMNYILEDEDNVAINNKISLVLGQLPVRLTKNKFFEMLSNGLSIYKGGQKDGLNDFLYMIRTSSMLEKTDTMAVNYPDLEQIVDELKSISFKEITKEQLEESQNSIVKASAYLEDAMSENMALQEVINDLLIVLYTNEFENDDKVTTACNQIVKWTNDAFLGKESDKSEEEIEDMFILLEGQQEELYPQLSAYDITDQIKESYKDKLSELGLTDIYETVYKLPILNSDSLFSDIDKVTDQTEVDEAYIKQVEESLFEEYAEIFKDTDKLINRAIMANTLSELPVFFNNISELQDYIYNTLSACNDKAEKLACIEILNGIMSE